MKARNIAMSVIFCLFPLGPAILFAGQRELHLDLPDWLTAKSASSLAGGLQTAGISSHASLDGFLEKQLQNAVEVQLGNYAPCKYRALTTNASWQRIGIAMSSRLFSWECYPTYYGSYRIATEGNDIVSYLPGMFSSSIQNHWRSFAEGVSTVAHQFPGKRFVVYVVPGYQEPGFNPAYALAPNPLHLQLRADSMEQALANSKNVTVLSRSFSGDSNTTKSSSILIIIGT